MLMLFVDDFQFRYCWAWEWSRSGLQPAVWICAAMEQRDGESQVVAADTVDLDGHGSSYNGRGGKARTHAASTIAETPPSPPPPTTEAAQSRKVR